MVSDFKFGGNRRIFGVDTTNFVWCRGGRRVISVPCRRCQRKQKNKISYVVHMWVRGVRHRLVSTWLADFQNNIPSIMCANNQEIDREQEQGPETILWWLREFKRICDEYGIQHHPQQTAPPNSQLFPSPFAHFSDKRMSFGIIADPASLTYRQRLHTYPMGSPAQAQIAAGAVEDLAHTEAVQPARTARRTASHRSVQKGSVLYAPEERNIAAVRVEDELGKAKALVDRAVKTEAKKQRKAFLDVVMAKRSEIIEARRARKKLRVERGREVKANVRALKKASGMCRYGWGHQVATE